MAGAVACLVPIGLFFMGYISYSNEYESRKSKITNLENDIEREQLRRLDAANANLRRNLYYKRKSLPSDDARAKVKYRDWLLDLVDQSGLTSASISRAEKSTIKHNDGGLSIVANKYRYTITTSGTLDEIIKFCHSFDEIDLLHNISTLSIMPSRGKRVSGVQNITMKVEVLSLLDAEEDRDFLNQKRTTATQLADYEKTILSRNIFGEPNTAPTISLSRKSFETGEDISFTIYGRDKDDDDLTYEIVDSGGIEGIELVPKSKNRATFTCPPLEVGEYTVLVSVKDTGYPQKTAQDDFKLVIKDPPPKTVKTKKPEPPPPPPFVHATKTVVKRINSRRKGNKPAVFFVKIDALTLGEKFELALEQEFELDEKTWVVKAISVNTVTLEVDGKELEYRRGDVLSEPRRETILEPVEAVEAAEISTVTD